MKTVNIFDLQSAKNNVCPVMNTYSHVRPAANVPGQGNGVNKLTGDTEIAQLELTEAVDKDVGRFDIYRAK